jgi:TPR repeat protein
MGLFGFGKKKAVPAQKTKAGSDWTAQEAIQAAVKAKEAKDFSKALELYQKAAELGSVDAMSACGNMYRRGLGTKKDNAKALYWYEQAAEHGRPAAQVICGLMYYNGQGTACDLAKSKAWFQKAAEQSEAPRDQELAKQFLRENF